MSTSSGFGPSSAVATNGSSAMPQIGQAPGPTCRDLRVHWAGVDRALRHIGRRSFVRREIFLRVGLERRAAAFAAKIVGAAAILSAVRRRVRIDIHAAYRILHELRCLATVAMLVMAMIVMSVVVVAVIVVVSHGRSPIVVKG